MKDKRKKREVLEEDDDELEDDDEEDLDEDLDDEDETPVVSKPKKDKEEKVEETSPRFIVANIPSAYKPAVVDRVKQEHYTIVDMLAKISNDLEDIKKRL